MNRREFIKGTVAVGALIAVPVFPDERRPAPTRKMFERCGMIVVSQETVGSSGCKSFMEWLDKNMPGSIPRNAVLVAADYTVQCLAYQAVYHHETFELRMPGAPVYQMEYVI